MLLPRGGLLRFRGHLIAPLGQLAVERFEGLPIVALLPRVFAPALRRRKIAAFDGLPGRGERFATLLGVTTSTGREGQDRKEKHRRDEPPAREHASP